MVPLAICRPKTRIPITDAPLVLHDVHLPVATTERFMLTRTACGWTVVQALNGVQRSMCEGQLRETEAQLSGQDSCRSQLQDLTGNTLFNVC